MYKAVLFDMDGTVLDTLGDLTDAVNYSLRAFDMPERSSLEVRSYLGRGPKYLISRAVPEGTAPELEARVLEVYKPYYDSHCQIKTAPYAGIVELMEKLHGLGLRLAVISNKQQEAVTPLAQRHFPGLLELAVGTGPKIACKPDPAAVLAAMDSLGLRPEETVYVGDMDIDLMTAGNAGIDAIGVAWGFMGHERLSELGAKRIADDPEQLFQMIVG